MIKAPPSLETEIPSYWGPRRDSLATEKNCLMPEDVAIIEELRRLTRETLNYRGPRGILAGLVHELVGVLQSVANFRIDEALDITEGETACGQGLAISPTQAAGCADEFLRTAAFLRGLQGAIEEALDSNSGRPVRVLYAGSGPYATLAVPLMSLFSPDEARFTILDLHAASIESVKSVVSGLGLDQSVESYVLGNACDYIIPGEALPDILLCETMSTALEKEPQVAIIRHLLAQAPKAIMVPESVRVDAFLVDTSKEPVIIIPESDDPLAKWQPDRIDMGPVFELNASTIHSWDPLAKERLPAATIHMPQPPDPGYRPFLFTTITTHGEHVLLTHDCNLTGIREIEGISAGETVHFHYRLGANPCLAFEAREQGKRGL